MVDVREGESGIAAWPWPPVNYATDSDSYLLFSNKICDELYLHALMKLKTI